ncbi:MAG: prolyl oligopeptidase family serine peptidase [Rhodomicrobium sp.]
MDKAVFPFGRWPSPITPEAVAGSSLRFGRVQIADGAVFWSEARPAEKGRATVMRWSAKSGAAELIPAPYSVRSRVHEYGGGEFLVAGASLYFVNDDDQQVYAASLAGGGIVRMTAVSNTRFADFAYDARRARLIAAGETHGGAALPENALWTIPASSDPAESAAMLLSGRDFYASPRLSPCGGFLAFLAWDLPHMPWDAARLFVAEVGADGALAEPAAIAGGDGSACFQPEWDKDGALYFVWDAGGAGALYRWRAGDAPRRIAALDGDLSMPLWSLNAASYALLDGGKAYLSFVTKGEARAAILDLSSGAVAARDNALTSVASVAGGGGAAALAGMTDGDGLCIVSDAVSPAVKGAPAIIRRASALAIDGATISKPRRIAIPSAQGEVYGLLYPPMNPAAAGPEGAPPPLIVNLHGGPTSAALRGLKPKTLFFTSRGFSLLDLDYSGSVGYGRAYRDRLLGAWGVADVEDTIAAARFAVSQGLADANAIFVTGGSAGGYTVLMTVARSGLFRGAASYYGICDLVALQRATHKFEQGYQSALLGGTLEDKEAVYRERSAISHVDAIATPLILFQGADDHVVPKEQSVMIADALRLKGVTVEYHEFEGEGHGFRKADTIIACLERELDFYCRLMRETPQSTF